MSKKFRIRNSWKEVVSDLKTFTNKGGKIAAQICFCFYADFPLQTMAETMLPDGLETSGWRVYRKFWHITRSFYNFAFSMIFSVLQKKIIFLVFWVIVEVLQRGGSQCSANSSLFANSSQIDLSQIYLLIFRSQIDSYSYSPRHIFHYGFLCPVSFSKEKYITVKKIPHTGDKASLDRCG